MYDSVLASWALRAGGWPLGGGSGCARAAAAGARVRGWSGSLTPPRWRRTGTEIQSCTALAAATHNMRIPTIALVAAGCCASAIAGGGPAPVPLSRSSGAATSMKQAACNISAPIDELCESFCSNKCAFFNATAGETGTPETVTVYRLTPSHITDMVNKDAGDPNGDLSFFLSRHDLRQECAQNSHAHGNGCFLAGNNVIVQWEVEVDGQWGSYQMCNPLHGWMNETTDAGWSCSLECLTPPDCPGWPNLNSVAYNQSGSMHGPACACARTDRTAGRVNRGYMAANGHAHMPRPPPPPQCRNFSLSWGTCFNQSGMIASIPIDWTKGNRSDPMVQSEIQCCDACQAMGVEGSDNRPICRGWSLRHNSSMGTSVCELHKQIDHTKWSPNGEQCMKAYHRSQPKPKGNHTKPPNQHHGSNWYEVEKILGGYWYSFPAAGECKGSARPGDDSGCTWRAKLLKKKINATCLGTMVDHAVEKAGAVCFASCPDPTNMTTSCADDCYISALVGNPEKGMKGMSVEQMLAPWAKAFGDGPGACPNV